MEIQKIDNVLEDTQPAPPAVMTPTLMELRIIAEIAKKSEVAPRKLTIADLETRALSLEKNEDHLSGMAILLEDLNEIENIANVTHKTNKQVFLDGAAACDAGKRLVFAETDRIRGMFEPDYDRLLEAIDERKRTAAQKLAQDNAIRKGIEDTATGFARLIAQAASREQLAAVERLINLEKSPSRAKKYGDFHAQATKRYDEFLIPIIQSQKAKVVKLEMLHGALEEAVSDSEDVEAGKLQVTIGEISQEIRQNQAAAEEILTQEFFPVVEAEEILPGYRTKRTDISFELENEEIALKKMRHVLIIDLDKKALRIIAKKLKKEGVFDGKKEVVIDGIKYIITRQREAL